MKSKININKNIKHKFLFLENETLYSTNCLFKPNKTISNFIFSTDLINNDMKSEYKSSFVQTSIITENFSKNNKIPQKLFTISNSRKKIPIKKKESQKKDSEIKRRKFQTRLIKEIKLNLENNSINKNNIKNKNEPKIYFNKKKKLKKKTIFPENKLNKNINNYKYNNSNTTRITYTNNPIDKYNSNYIKNKDNNNKKCQIKIIKNRCYNENLYNNIKTDINEKRTIDNNKLKLNKNENKNKNKLSENKNVVKKEKHNFEEINKNELKIMTKKRTFVQREISSKLNNYFNYNSINSSKFNKKKDYFSYFINAYSKDKNKTKIINNKRKINIRSNNKENISIFNSNFSKNNTNFELCKNVDIQKFNKIKIEEYKNKKLIHKNNIKKNKTNIISQIKSENNLNKLNLVPEKYKKLFLQRKELIKNGSQNNKNNENNENIESFGKNIKKNNSKNDDEELLDTGTELKNKINQIKSNNYGVNKPKETNMKFTLVKELEDEEDNLNINKSRIENIIIGKIDGYKDIIESDELNKIFKLRSKSSFDIHNKIAEKLIKKEKNEKRNDKNLKSFSNNKTSFVSMHILEDNSSEIEDLDFDNNNYRVNEQLLNIENEYAFEEMAIYEKETINKDNNLLPFQLSKISFYKYYDTNDRQYKTNENIDKNNISLTDINKYSTKKIDKTKNKGNKSMSLTLSVSTVTESHPLSVRVVS